MQSKTIILLLVHTAVVFLILLAAFSPLIGVFIAGEIASAHGCPLDEGSVHPCVVNGQDLGETLYTLGVGGWLMLATIPVGLAAAALYIVIVGVVFLLRRSARLKKTRALERPEGCKII